MCNALAVVQLSCTAALATVPIGGGGGGGILNLCGCKHNTLGPRGPRFDFLTWKMLSLSLKHD